MTMDVGGIFNCPALSPLGRGVPAILAPTHPPHFLVNDANPCIGQGGVKETSEPRTEGRKSGDCLVHLLSCRLCLPAAERGNGV